MKSRTFTLHGKTNTNGILQSANMGEFIEFCKKWPNHSFTLEAELIPEGTSAALIGYYYKSIVPQFQEAYREKGYNYTKSETDMKLRELSPVMQKEEHVPDHGLVIDYCISIDKAGNSRAVEFIEDLKRIGSQEFDVVIKDPKTI